MLDLKNIAILLMMSFLIASESMAANDAISPIDERLTSVQTKCTPIQNQKFPNGIPDVADNDYDFIEEKCGFACPNDARAMLKVLYKYELPFSVKSPMLNGINYLAKLMDEAFGPRRHIPTHVIPFANNGDGCYWCITRDSHIVLYQPQWNDPVSTIIGDPYTLVDWVDEWVLKD